MNVRGGGGWALAEVYFLLCAIVVCNVFCDYPDDVTKLKHVGLILKLIILLQALPEFLPRSTLSSPCTLEVGEVVPKSLYPANA